MWLLNRVNLHLITPVTSSTRVARCFNACTHFIRVSLVISTSVAIFRGRCGRTVTWNFFGCSGRSNVTGISAVRSAGDTKGIKINTTRGTCPGTKESQRPAKVAPQLRGSNLGPSSCEARGEERSSQRGEKLVNDAKELPHERKNLQNQHQHQNRGKEGYRIRLDQFPSREETEYVTILYIK